ncbi:nicotinate-nucleotide--dimethylbenzimidazole phosphoribosyltransferase [Candidatus Methanophagaceae archaeon]|nr:nicotinate-nucleotide--dimethylbenzimidazole phosphoribosyltransferase [Methanophagales archaeon]
MDRLKETIERIEPLNGEVMEAARARQDTLTKPLRSLGVLEDISVRVAGITGNYMPELKHKVILTMASDHGIVAEGVSAYPQEVTLQMVYNFINGGAGINVLARHIGARVVVVDMGVAADFAITNKTENFIDNKIAYGTANMTQGAAMSYDAAKQSIEAGIEVLENVLENGVDIVGVGDMGIGNTTSSSAITAFITGEAVETVTGRGTGLDDAGLTRKIEQIQKALDINTPDRGDAIDILAKIGGFEIGGIAGAILAAAAHRIPVVIDGFIAGAAALIAYELSPRIKEYSIASHLSVEAGHRAILDYMGLVPLLNLNMRLGEGTGAALGMGIVDASCKILREMATFEEAGVAEKE